MTTERGCSVANAIASSAALDTPMRSSETGAEHGLLAQLLFLLWRVGCLTDQPGCKNRGVWAVSRRTGLFVVSYVPLAAMFVVLKWRTAGMRGS